MKINEFVKDFDVRFIDLNAGNHLSNHLLLGYITDYIAVYLAKHGWNYGDVYGHRILFSQILLQLKREVFQSDLVKISVNNVEIKSRKLILSFVAKVEDKVVATTTHEINFLKDNRVVRINEDIEQLFSC